MSSSPESTVTDVTKSSLTKGNLESIPNSGWLSIHRFLGTPASASPYHIAAMDNRGEHLKGITQQVNEIDDILRNKR